jgi:hypothetical protein
MSFHRALGAFVLAGLVLAGCNKAADKGKTVDLLVSKGLTKEQATCITDDVWAKIPAKERNRLTDANATLTPEQQTIFNKATLTCARDTVVKQMKDAISSANASATPAQIDCIVGKLSDDDIAGLMEGKSDAVTTAVAACVTPG